MKWTVGVLLEIETDDAALDLSNPLTATSPGIARARRALLEHLPKQVRRVVALIPQDDAAPAIRVDPDRPKRRGRGRSKA